MDQGNTQTSMVGESEEHFESGATVLGGGRSSSLVESRGRWER